MDRSSCSEECRARSPLGSDGHISTCPAFMSAFGDNVAPLFPRREQGETVVVRGPDDRPVAVPDEIIEEAERDFRAFQKWNAGKTWEQVAAEEMYDSADAAAAAVKRYLAEGRAVIRDMTRQEMLAAYIARLNGYRAALAAGIQSGKPQAITAVLAVEDRWVKAFGFDQPDAEDHGVQTVVVPHDGYLESLQAAAEPRAVESAG